MNAQKLLDPLFRQLDLLTQVLNESPYISREVRLGISKEITDLSTQLQEGEVSLPQGEETLNHLDKRAAVDEIVTLAAKIRQLNPSSPRLEYLGSLETELHADEISPEQARKRLQELMRA